MVLSRREEHLVELVEQLAQPAVQWELSQVMAVRGSISLDTSAYLGADRGLLSPLSGLGEPFARMSPEPKLED